MKFIPLEKLAEMDATKQKQLSDVIDTELLGLFEEITLDGQGDF